MSSKLVKAKLAGIDWPEVDEVLIGEAEEIDGTPLKPKNGERYTYVGGGRRSGRQAGKTRQLLKMAYKSVMAGKTVAVVRDGEVIVVRLSDKELAERKELARRSE